MRAKSGGLLEGLGREGVQEPHPVRQRRVRQCCDPPRPFIVKGGTYADGTYPDIDAFFQKQAAELDHKHREATLHKIQQLVCKNSMVGPIWQLAFINGVGPRV
jgi:peptide/nickel transport system substrate-binding protein